MQGVAPSCLVAMDSEEAWLGYWKFTDGKDHEADRLPSKLSDSINGHGLYHITDVSLCSWAGVRFQKFHERKIAFFPRPNSLTAQQVGKA